jgi:hypothetical protein
MRTLFGTFSPFLALGEDLRARCLDVVEEVARAVAVDGVVTRPYRTAVHLACRR